MGNWRTCFLILAGEVSDCFVKLWRWTFAHETWLWYRS
uniref:Uncharacterized protein n=1 Tax=Arundo donax TaxID=35708 RepID=A0A0A9EHE8_ARUDO